ncbi:sulfotransferase family 2 domain-containing protein [Paracoccus sp. MBLB3053]|uniref:Sulfotransferase family 2 domain-containing protein n=1 Tax=Paracoccus aurantius TaxID=3073814 RepID=A0ABU2HQB3_9RHOB|nr:sulfotransferase family 2 domain-containing protein [Paracoccus sp. MBLB3053]MDS9467228.1 sulfotransferase family 2 domain-containing protein [Paracoccus sp. MBLB3053]
MLIFWEKRLVFLATPKAGSTAVEAALESLSNVAVQRPAELKHTNLASYRRHIEPWLHDVTGERFTTVSLMRQPLDWLRSWYRFRLRDDHDDPDHTALTLSFRDFVEAYSAPESDHFRTIGTQCDFLTHQGDKIDRIFRYEEIDDFTQFLEDRLDCAITLPRVNVPPAVDVTLDSGEEAALRDFLARDIALYASL